MRSLRWGPHGDLSALMALEVAYLGNCLLCLVLFLREWQRGAYCALVTAVVYLLHVILVSAQRRTPEVGMKDISITEEMES